MTELIFGRLKRRWPIVKSLRVEYSNAVNIIMAAAILHNVGVRWQDEADDLPDLAPPLDHDDRLANERFRPGMPEGARRLRTRREGEEVRDNLRLNMPPPSQRELRKM